MLEGRSQYFLAANGKPFSTKYISKKQIGIRIFLGIITWMNVASTDLTGKDVLLGFDFIQQLAQLRIGISGLYNKRQFKAYTDVHNLFSLQPSPISIHPLMEQFFHLFTESHVEFTHANPLWQNPDFYIRLPFKKNEEINPTKASRAGMTPSDLKLAKEECLQLIQ